MQGGLNVVQRNGIGYRAKMAYRQWPAPIADPLGEGRKNGRATGPPALQWPRGSPGLRKTDPLNNNRGNNNNRRRGRGNNNGRPQGGNQQVNRIDSRARGNAPQLLEKYRKLAHDAHLNGDRVTAEYYLQFADHYFRVIADTRQRQEEARARRDDRWQEGGESQRDEGDDGSDFSVESDFPAFDQPPVYTRREREDRHENGRSENGRLEGGRGDGARSEQGRSDYGSRQDRRRDEAPRREDAPRREAEPVATGESESTGDEPVTVYEPAENPFLRESRAVRTPRARREDRRPPRGERREASAGADVAPVAEVAPAMDPALLPPSISAGRKSEEAPVAEEAPAPKKRARRKTAAEKAAEAAGDEPLKQVG